jgi:hypothetical protein
VKKWINLKINKMDLEFEFSDECFEVWSSIESNKRSKMVQYFQIQLETIKDKDLLRLIENKEVLVLEDLKSLDKVWLFSIDSIDFKNRIAVLGYSGVCS